MTLPCLGLGYCNSLHNLLWSFDLLFVNWVSFLSLTSCMGLSISSYFTINLQKVVNRELRKVRKWLDANSL